MSQPTEEMRPSKMWRTLPTDVRVSACQAFWSDEQAALEQAEAVALISGHLTFRPKSGIALSTETKPRHLASLARVSDLLAARLLVAYHLAHQRPMMGAFLDALGIAHDQGLIRDESPKAPEAEALDRAVQTLTASYPKAD